MHTIGQTHPRRHWMAALTLLVFGLALAAGHTPAQAQTTDPFAQFNTGAAGEGAGEGADPFAQFNAPGGGEAAPLAATPALEWSGFVEVERAAHLGEESPVGRDFIQDNTRVRLKTSLQNRHGGAFFKLDFTEDGITGSSAVDVREARLQYTPWRWLDLNVGKQVSTWGVGDMVFINDLFPKNWVAMFTGRDMELWKDSANALRVAAFAGPLTWDTVWHPRFAPDTTPTGCRFAVFDPNSGQVSAFPSTCGGPAPAASLTGQDEDGELAMRLKMMVGGFELALYGYQGFFKSPRGLRWLDAQGQPVSGVPNPAGGDWLAPYYPELQVTGLSLEGQAGAGIFSLEAGYYDSREDPEGDQFLIENSMVKYLVGYRMDFSAHFGAGLQWYSEEMAQYEAYEAAYLANNPAGYAFRKDKKRDTYTLRLTFKFQQDTFWINYFTYQRPQEMDSYQKLDFTKRLDDNFVLAGSLNVFAGDDDRRDREFSMVRDDDNAALRLTYNF